MNSRHLGANIGRLGVNEAFGRLATSDPKTLPSLAFLAMNISMSMNGRVITRWILFSFVWALSLSVGLISCRENSNLPVTPQSPVAKSEIAEESSVERQEYRVQGVVKEVIPDKNRVRIAHEEIPGYMAAMTMLFDVKDSQELEGVAAGDKVQFLMVVTIDDGWIEEVQRIGQVEELVTDEPNSFRLVRDVDPLEIGDAMTDYSFTNEMGQTVRLSDYKGKAIALTFIFTRCPFPTFCPRMSAFFQSAYEELKSMDNGPDNWHLFSVTIDPQFDTPQVLKKYAQAYTYDPERWNYLTGQLIDITAISEQFGLQFYRPDPDNPANLSHNLRTVVINAAGQVHHLLIGNEWKPSQLAKAMVEAAQVESAGE